MSGIYIPGMVMQTSCVKCLLNSDSKCLIMPSVGYDDTNGSGRRQNCPLVHVPEHGDLIERSAATLSDFEIAVCGGNFREGLRMLCENIDAAPTIIPADKEETE